MRWLAGTLLMWNVFAWADDPLHNTVDDAVLGANGYQLSGRVTEARAAAHAGSNGFKTLYRSARQLLTDGEEAVVELSISDYQWRTHVDSQGYWLLAQDTPLPLAPGWHAMSSIPPASSTARLLVPHPDNRIGIISDVDDTLVVSQVNAKSSLLRNSLMRPAEGRQAFAGTAELYTRIAASNPQPATMAVFYLSASPRQFTDNLRRFLAAQAFPQGVLLTKRWGEGSLTDQRSYKTARLEAVLAALPKVRFYLFGDDGEQDPEIYDQLRQRYPDRIAGIWIRRVNPNPARPRLPDQGDLGALAADPSLLR
ncbi:phosphatase domain-containing protein [Chitinolyticbacter meiyuanensis]|uniref:phosphatase domain-containing protein n=1 Tax=Chitinolyticbacter meiyuanensis TaxID=682798 RepID=UPI0011E5DDAE|nr:phosphatase domain-containing protein [Chitinolyticbacter meiyuanensis]